MYTITLLVAVIVSGSCSPEDTYHIKPFTNATCNNAQLCIILSEFAQRNRKPAKIVEHTLSSNMLVANSNSYILIGFKVKELRQ